MIWSGDPISPQPAITNCRAWVFIPAQTSHPRIRVSEPASRVGRCGFPWLTLSGWPTGLASRARSVLAGAGLEASALADAGAHLVRAPGLEREGHAAYAGLRPEPKSGDAAQTRAVGADKSGAVPGDLGTAVTARLLPILSKASTLPTRAIRGCPATLRTPLHLRRRPVTVMPKCISGTLWPGPCGP
jgi:hypothetical protein